VDYLKNTSRRQRVIGAFVFAGVMAWLLVGIRAGGPYASLESESGSVASPASVVPDGQASGGSYVNFESNSNQSRYWEWGWGHYHSDTTVATQAAFDWSTINFGNVSDNQSTIDRLNQMLAINPNHKFVIRVWPILGLGDSIDENRYQGTLFHYLFKPGVREAIHQKARDQVNLVLNGISKPENVVGSTFLEESPNHFTTGRDILGWSRGQPMPWDVARFESQLNAAVGGTFDMANQAHRLWWGDQYANAVNEINSVIKEASGGRDVFIWNATSFRTMDMLGQGESIFQSHVIPINYTDILDPDYVDGIFGYPNTQGIWDTETMNFVRNHNLLFFSQTSTPGFMRASTWDETVRLAQEEDPRNLGTFFYSQPSVPGWNPTPYETGSQVFTNEEHGLFLYDLFFP